jgi:hypothetical protein
VVVQTESVNVVGLIDDGVFFIFQVGGGPGILPLQFGFMHRPIEASEPFGNPPVTWSEFSDLGTWVETVKYAFRTQQPIEITFDIATEFTYVPPYNPTGGFTLIQLYAVGNGTL